MLLSDVIAVLYSLVVKELGFSSFCDERYEILEDSEFD